jgi:predicted hotdog family 3-hydroxylacyl-ACP dehydratase
VNALASIRMCQMLAAHASIRRVNRPRNRTVQRRKGFLAAARKISGLRRGIDPPPG